MSAVTWADLVAKLPAAELATVAADVQADILAFVHEVLNAGRLGGEGSARLRRIRMLLAAHMATVTTPGTPGSAATTGAVISESTSKISRSYAQVMADSDFAGSSYGQEYARMIRNSPARLPMVV